MKPKLIAILVLILLLLTLIIQNSQAITLRVFFWQLSMSGILLFPLIFLIGALIGIISFYLFRKKS